MAEFSEVMKQWNRRLEAEHMLFDGDVIGIDVLWLAMEHPEQVESKIMSWAAEHPEPVYPTWREYLESIGVIVPRKNYTVMDAYALIISQINTTRISADIAQKLGIEPKEG